MVVGAPVVAAVGAGVRLPDPAHRYAVDLGRQCRRSAGCVHRLVRRRAVGWLADVSQLRLVPFRNLWSDGRSGNHRDHRGPGRLRAAESKPVRRWSSSCAPVRAWRPLPGSPWPPSDRRDPRRRGQRRLRGPLHGRRASAVSAGRGHRSGDHARPPFSLWMHGGPLPGRTADGLRRESSTENRSGARGGGAQRPSPGR